jgi:hypothetical protein
MRVSLKHCSENFRILVDDRAMDWNFTVVADDFKVTVERISEERLLIRNI